MLEVQPEYAKEMRQNNKGEWEALIKWKVLHEFENSCELVDKMKNEFPEILLEDKEKFEGGGGY